VLAVIVASASYRLLTVDLPTYAVVVSQQDATVRFEPSATGTAHFKSKPGSVLRLLGGREDWVQVSRGDGRRGWIERTVLAPL
jgi:SH3-like domain-containing protein